jgi:hypothetical protein
VASLRQIKGSEISGSHGGEYEDGLSSGSLRRVVWYKFTDVSEMLAASIFRAMSDSADDGGSKHL